MNPELARLRAEVNKRRAAATSKIGRLRKQGVEVSGSIEDVRRSLSKTDRYTIPQLRSYLRDLNRFTDRKTQFVAGAAGAPIAREKWHTYIALQDRFNIKVMQHNSSVADFAALGGGTIGESLPDVTQKKKRTAAGDIVNKPLYQFNREPHRIAGSGALDVLMRDMRKRLSRGYVSKANKETEVSFIKILADIGDHEAQEKLAALTPHQMDVLFNYNPQFASALLQTYGFNTMDAGDKYRNVIDDNMKEIHEQLEWAAKLPKTIKR